MYGQNLFNSPHDFTPDPDAAFVNERINWASVDFSQPGFRSKAWKGTNNAWTEYFDDNRMLVQINKDCRRLCPDLDFFRQPTNFPGSTAFNNPTASYALRDRIETNFLQSHFLDKNLVGASRLVKTSNGASSYSQSGSFGDECPTDSSAAEPHWRVIERILFINYKTHNRFGYIQGMNEVIAPLYYVFANDPEVEWKRHAEADTFFCFNNLMTEISHNFTHKLEGGGQQNIEDEYHKLFKLLERFDPKILIHIKSLKIIPQHFAFRWISILLTREFDLPKVLQLWDTLLADKNRFAMLPYICCAMMMLIRDQLLQSDFANALKLLQDYPETVPIRDVINKGTELYKHHR